MYGSMGEIIPKRETLMCVLLSVQETDDRSVEQRMKEIPVSGFTIRNCVKFCVQKGWIKKKKVGRGNILTLTEKGKKIMRALWKVEKICNEL